MSRRSVAAYLCVLALVAMMGAALGQSAAAQPSATAVTPDAWPKTTAVNGVTYAMEQPQVERWDGYHFTGRAVVSVLPAGARDRTLGVMRLQAKTMTDRQAQTVYFDQITVQELSFPGNPRGDAAYRPIFQRLVSQGPSSLPLARLTSALAAQDDDPRDPSAAAVANTPPRFIFTQSPAVLVLIDGDPVWRPLPGTNLQRVINTRALILRDASGTLWVHLFDGYLTASRLTGPWRVATNVPVEAGPLAQNLADANVVDLMPGEPDDTTNQAPTLRDGAPQLIVATTPTELIVTDGAPRWLPIAGTTLQYVDNTTGDVFRDQRDRQLYVLVTGRWFRAPGFDGPWQYVAARALPGDFAKIPDDSPKENVKASIPSTPQAEDALLANQIPQMAEVDPAQTRFAPTLRGAPILTPIAGTPLLTVQNSQTPIIRVDDTHWYAVQDGVWFTAPALAGPWAVATSVPPVIYTIPPSSPLYYVTFVKIYDVTSSRVVEGYTPGYLGAVSTSDGVVVYGTGYSYPSPIIENVWYPAPVTYGYAANNCWTPWTGWIIGFGFGWTFGAEFDEHHHHRPWGWGPAPYWGAHFHRFVGPGRRGPGWGPNRWTATGVDVYRHWGRTPGTRSPSGFNAWGGNAWSNRVGHAYNSTTGHVAAGERVPVTNVYTGNFAYRNRGRTTAPATPPRGQQPPGGGVFTDRNGSIYRSSNNRIQQFNNGQWRNVPDQQRVQTLRSQQQWSLRAGDQRAAGSSWSGAWGNNFRPGAGRPSGGSQWNGGQFGSSRGNLGSFHGGRTGSSPRGGGGSGSARGGGGRR